jgi:DNA-binding IclR family transcriptional regulator
MTTPARAQAPDAAAQDGEAPGAESIALRAFAVLEHLVAADTPLSLDDVTTALQLPKPTLYRILMLLHEAGLLRRDAGTRRYTVGPRLAAFAVNLWRNDTLRAQWHGALQAAVAETGESCNLTLLEGRQVLYLDRVETAHPLRLHLEIGTRVPLHCTASGKLFLSGMAPDDARRLLGDEPYTAYTAHTLVSFDALAAQLAQVRKTGVATHDGELFADSVAIAVPVWGPDGSISAAVAVHAPASRASIRRCMDFVPALRRAADSIAAAMHPVRAGARAPRAEAAAVQPALGSGGGRL